MIYYMIVFIMVVISIMLVGIILLQQSKSGGMGTAMGQSAMNAAFGGQGADKLLTKITAGLAGTWMALALLINLISHPDIESAISSESVISQRAVPMEQPLDESVLLNNSLNQDVSTDSGK